MQERYKEGAYKIAKLVTDLAPEYASGNEAMLVFLHKSVDGDCVGSATALVSVLRKLGISSYVAMAEEIPETMAFLDVEEFLYYPVVSFREVGIIDGKKVTRAFSVDCTEGHRMAGNLGSLYDSYEDNLTIDHHEVTHLETPYKWIAPYGSSACELVYYFAEAVADILGKDISDMIDSRAAQGLLAGIVTDTGRFTYSNTNSETLEVAGKLMELGGRIGEICYNLFDRKTKPEFLMSNTISSLAEFYCDGKVAIATASQSQFKEFSANDDAIADVVSKLRDVDGVVFALVLRETSDGSIRGNLRSKGSFDCTKIAGIYDGGGHKNASGFTLKGDSGETFESIKTKILNEVNNFL